MASIGKGLLAVLLPSFLSVNRCLICKMRVFSPSGAICFRIFAASPGMITSAAPFSSHFCHCLLDASP